MIFDNPYTLTIENVKQASTVEEILEIGSNDKLIKDKFTAMGYETNLNDNQPTIVKGDSDKKVKDNKTKVSQIVDTKAVNDIKDTKADSDIEEINPPEKVLTSTTRVSFDRAKAYFMKPRTLLDGSDYKFLYAKFSCEICNDNMDMMVTVGNEAYYEACMKTNRWWETDLFGFFYN